MNPRHNNPTRPDRVAHAPYNFVPLPEQIVQTDYEIPGHDVYTGHTGYLDCTLTTLTPTYTRAAMTPDFFAEWADRINEMMQNDQAREKYAQFFHLDDAEHPVIPGSSLRGMTRMLVEIAGYGKVQWVTDEQLIFRAVGDPTSLGRYYNRRLLQDDGRKYLTPLVRAGYLEKRGGHWFIRPSQAIDGTTFARIHIDDIPSGLPQWHGCKNAYRIWVRLGRYGYQEIKGGFIHLEYTPVLEAYNSASDGLQEAVLAYSGHMSSKRHEAVIFPPDPAASPITISDDLLRAYREQISREQKKLLGDQGALNPHQPVFYLMENNRLIFFGHLMMFRLPYEHSPLDLVSKALCREDSTDLAEALFGYVSSAYRQNGRSGRVFFTDAQFESAQGCIWLIDDPVTPQILSGPKPTTFQHYLTQQQPDKVKSGRRYKDGTPKMELRLDHYASPPPHETVIRGHKLYWHKQEGLATMDFVEAKTPDWSSDKQHTQIKPVQPGVTFRFRVYFENLTEVELGALLWALDLPVGHHHKIGMGKPLGLGSVAIKPWLVLTDRLARYRQLFDENEWYTSERKDPDREQFRQAFEQYILKHMSQNERGNAQSLAQVTRIQMLLKMLEWPGPDRALTEYMVIEPNNEYKERPVLPDPLHVERASAPSPRRHTGRVKWFSDEKGYGFIQVDGMQKDVFVHHTNIEGGGFRTLNEGDRVEFLVEEDVKGLKAANVRVIKD